MTPVRPSNPPSFTATTEVRPHAGIPSICTVGIAPKQRSITLLVAAVWLCFFIRAVFYSSVMPVWEGYDESSHFSFVEYLATQHKLPDPRSSTGSPAVADSIQLAPVPWTIRGESPGEITQDEFWRLPEQSRLERAQALRAIDGEHARDPMKPGRLIYEAQQPPLAYLVLLTAFLPFRHASLLTQAWVVRIAGSLVASLAIPLCFLVGRKVFRNDWQAIGMTALIASMPELMILISHGGNEPLALVAGTTCVYGLICLSDWDKTLTQAAGLGVVLGLTLLTKAYFLALIPALCFICGIAWFKQRGRRNEIARQFLFTLGLAILIAGWWYGRNLSMTGSLSGEQTDIAAHQTGLSILQAVMRADWIHAADFALTTHVWIGGWSFLVLRSWMYKAVAALLVAAAAGTMLLIVRQRSRYLVICGTVFLFFWMAPAWHALADYRVTGKTESMGYYALSIVAAEAVCLIAGLRALLPGAARRFVIPGLITIFAAFDIYGMAFLLMPYYGGFIAHSASGSVPALHLGQLTNGGIARLFRNLALVKPWFLPPSVLMTLFAFYIFATGGVIAIGALCSARTQNDSAAGP